MSHIAVIDIAPLLAGDDSPEAHVVGAALDRACRDTGFFLVTGHGVQTDLVTTLDAASRRFFALDAEQKQSVAMARSASAWRGWFPPGGEMTSGVPDRKEGYYFGAELGPDDARVAARVPLHGANLFPTAVPELGPAVLSWIDHLTRVGHAVLRGLALGLGLDGGWFADTIAADPTVLFRIFRYPPVDIDVAAPDGTPAGTWGVAEHTDYGLLTLLWQDDCGGLQVKATQGWIDVAPLEGAFVCNIGDMLERMTGGRYRSTPHRVSNTSGRERLSFPFFFDPSWNARIEPLPLVADAEPQRWDGRSVFDFDGTYGEYLSAKVRRVFPELFASVIQGSGRVQS